MTERFIDAHFPGATIAMASGSTARGTRTRDIGLVLVGEELFADERASLAGTFRVESEVFEVFEYTLAGFVT
ncbi:MAG: hypothetical protein ACTHZX_01430 [Microbacterium sp.]